MSMHPTRNYFAEFKGDKRIFIETGTYRGDGIQLALDAGFERIYSMDIDPANIDFAMARFDMHSGAYPNIRLYNGDSGESLDQILQHIKEPAVFWLDAHCQMLEGEPEGDNPWPLMKELVQILKTGMKEHTILIDDLLMITHPDVTGWTLYEITRALNNINSQYKIDLLPNPIKNNILVAHV